MGYEVKHILRVLLTEAVPSDPTAHCGFREFLEEGAEFQGKGPKLMPRAFSVWFIEILCY